MKRVLVVVDMQNDFIDGALANEGAQAILPEVCALIKDFNDAGDVVIFTRDAHDEDYLETQEGRNLPIAHCIYDTNGIELHPAIQEVQHARNGVVDKDAFGAYDLPDVIDDATEGDEIEEIIFVGVCTGICVISNVAIVKASFPEVLVTVFADACACLNEATHKQALEAMKVFQVNIVEG